jgi:outer membrane receptor protein involved in Fe transport
LAFRQEIDTPLQKRQKSAAVDPERRGAGRPPCHDLPGPFSKLIQEKLARRDADSMRLSRARKLAFSFLLSSGFVQNMVGQRQASLEDLMDITVTSVSKKEEKLSKTAAAVFVITQEAPSVNVARIDANTWAVSIRAFNSRYSDKILVLIDGRSVYSPSFSGVLWDQIDVPLEDIEQIEVIRGPGETVWGANAMNGVINVITMSSKATEGGLLVASAGSKELGSLAQYGGNVGALGTRRAFGKYFNIDNSARPAGGEAEDGWHGFHGGFRSDLQPSPQDSLMVQGDLYSTAEGQTLTTVLSNNLPAVATIQRRDCGRQRRSPGAPEPHAAGRLRSVVERI